MLQVIFLVAKYSLNNTCSVTCRGKTHVKLTDLSVIASLSCSPEHTYLQSSMTGIFSFLLQNISCHQIVATQTLPQDLKSLSLKNKKLQHKIEYFHLKPLLLYYLDLLSNLGLWREDHWLQQVGDQRILHVCAWLNCIKEFFYKKYIVSRAGSSLETQSPPRLLHSVGYRKGGSSQSA